MLLLHPLTWLWSTGARLRGWPQEPAHGQRQRAPGDGKFSKLRLRLRHWTGRTSQVAGKTGSLSGKQNKRSPAKLTHHNLRPQLSERGGADGTLHHPNSMQLLFDKPGRSPDFDELWQNQRFMIHILIISWLDDWHPYISVCWLSTLVSAQGPNAISRLQER